MTLLNIDSIESGAGLTVCGIGRRGHRSRVELAWGGRMTHMRRVIGDQEAGTELRHIARGKVAGAQGGSRFSLSKMTSNAKGER